MEILYKDRDILVCVKPPRVLSTDEPGGLPELVRQELGDPKADVRTVHRLDRVVSGLMVISSFGIRGSWMAFIYAVPVNAIVLLSLRSAWGLFSWNKGLISVIVWGCLASIYVSLKMILKVSLWKLFLLGIPGQVAIFLWFRMFRTPETAQEEEPSDAE